MTFTVTICTWNRASLLRQTLERLTRVERPGVPWDLVVVDNHSTDETERVLDAFTGRLPLRRVFEAEPGLSHARNAAIPSVTGDYVVWTDDDVLVDAGWLCAYERAIKRWPEAAVLGGPVRPRFEGTPPAWLTGTWQVVGGAFARRELGPEPMMLDGKENIPYGANFVVRMREQQRFLYDPALGRKQMGGTLGEETALIRAILASGGTGWWVPDALVEHWIPKERQTVKYLRQYYMLVGRSDYRQTPPGTPMLWGRPRWVWRKALRAELSYRFARLTGSPRRWVKLLVQASKLWGIEGRRPPQ